MQNIQSLLYSPGANKYICKYIVILDENNCIVVSTNAHKNGELITKSTFLHNTKIATSAFNEKATLEKSKKKSSKRMQDQFNGNDTDDFELS